MSDELTQLLLALRAARQANEAAIQTIVAVEEMLGFSNTLESVPDNNEVQLGLDLEGCSHEKVMLVSTMSGNYKLCECGHQIKI